MGQGHRAVHPEGTPDNERMRSFIGLTSLLPESESQDEDIDVEDMGDGAVWFRIELAPAEDRINAAVASLGDRKGTHIEDIVADLTEALHARELDLSTGDLNGIAAELSRGEEVIVQVVTDDSDGGRLPGGPW